MACTAAVEEEIDRHYTRQLDELEADGDDPELAGDDRPSSATTSASTATRRSPPGPSARPAYPLLSAAIRLGCRAAIRLSERI